MEITSKEKATRHPLIDEYYRRAMTRSDGRGSVSTWLDSDDPDEKMERIGYLIGLFDSQISRNGTQLWITNGYWDNDGDIIRVLDEVAVRRRGEVQKLLRQVREIGERAVVLEEEDSPQADRKLDVLAARCEALDDAYLAMREELLDDVEARLVDMKASVAQVGAPGAEVAAVRGRGDGR